MGRLPEGTVTFLFTDIEGSTRLLQDLGAAYADALLEHRALLRAAFGRHRGVEVDTAGDSFFVAFSSPADAVEAALEAQQALAGGRIRVRMGLHTGEPAVVGEGYVGIDVHRAARISAAAHGGQVVVSERTKSFLSDGLEVRDLGTHRLKDLIAPEHLYQLGSGVFPPLRTLNATNLPTQPTPLIGRLREIAEVATMLGTARVVTLTGPGGTGKTRLAVQTAAEAVDRFPDGVVWVPLATVEDPELVLPTIGDTLGTDRPVAEHIDAKRMLVVLDNLEQVLDSATDLSDLVRSCPNLCLLVTSRAPLRIDGEREYAVDPLPEADAITLFRERAFDEETTAVIAEICRRVDRLPLAVELAAARTRLFSPSQLLERLEHVLPILTDGRRDAPPRHRALRDTIAWSHDLLTSQAQRLFAALGVFAGSFDLEGAERVAGATVEGMESLVESSLVGRAGDRFAMLETIREFAQESLEGLGDSKDARDRHLRYFLELAERVEARTHGSESAGWIARFRRDEDNLRAAIAWALETGAKSEALRLCAATATYWQATTRIVEGIRWFDRAFASNGEVEATIRARALSQSGWLLTYDNQEQEGVARLEEAVAIWRVMGEGPELAEALAALCATLSIADPSRVRQHLEEALHVSMRTGYARGEARVLHLLGEVLRNAGDFDEAARLLQRSMALSSTHNWQDQWGATAHSYADLELDRRDLEKAESLYRDGLRNAGVTGVDRLAVYCLAGLASVASLRGDAERAARLWAAVENAERSSAFRLVDSERRRYERCLVDLPRWRGEPPALDEAVLLALGDEADAPA